MAAVKFEGIKFRTFPHSNSKRKQIDRDKEDREEALEYTTDYSEEQVSLWRNPKPQASC